MINNNTTIVQRKSVSGQEERKGEEGQSDQSDQANGNNQYLGTKETTFSHAVSFYNKISSSSYILV